MRYAQIDSGQKLHLVFEFANGNVSQPICGRKTDHYRMTINIPLAHACKNCQKVTQERRREIQAELAKTADLSSIVH